MALVIQHSWHRYSAAVLKAASNTAPMSMTTGMSVRGFWRIGRLVSRVIMEDDDVKLNAINARPATNDCMACQCKYDTIRCRDPKEVGWDALGANCVCESTGILGRLPGRHHGRQR